MKQVEIKNRWLVQESLDLPTIVKADKSSGTREAEFRDSKIIIYPKFFKHPVLTQKWILAHELGHWIRDNKIDLKDIVGWSEGENFWIFDRENSEEGFAEAFAYYIYDRSFFKNKYPNQYDRMASLIGNISDFKNWIEKVTGLKI